MLIEIIKTNYVFIHPKNANINELNGYKKCKEVIDEFKDIKEDEDLFGKPENIAKQKFMDILLFIGLMNESVDVILQELMATVDVISSAVYICLECRLSMSGK